MIQKPSPRCAFYKKVLGNYAVNLLENSLDEV